MQRLYEGMEIKRMAGMVPGYVGKTKRMVGTISGYVGMKKRK